MQSLRRRTLPFAVALLGSIALIASADEPIRYADQIQPLGVLHKHYPRRLRASPQILGTTTST